MWSQYMAYGSVRLGKSIHNPLRFDVWTLNPLNSKTGYFTPQTLQNQTNHPLGWFCGRFC